MSQPQQPVRVHIATSSIAKVFAFILGLGLLYLVRRILILVFIAVLLAIAFAPAVRALQLRLRLPRPLSVAVIFVGLIAFVGTTLGLLAQPLASEISHLSANFPAYWQSASQRLAGLQDYSTMLGGNQETIQRALGSIGSTFEGAAGNVIAFLVQLLGGVLSLILVLVLTFYLLAQEDAIRGTLLAVSPPRYHAYLPGLVGRLETRLGMWLRGELILGLVVGGLSLVGLSLLGVKYAVVLALVAGVFELIPYIGPLVGAIPAVFLTLVADSPWKAVAVAVLYWLIQQLENHLIVPKVMQRTVGLNPIVVIISVLLGAQLAGFIGVLIAVPTVAALSVILADWQSSQRPQELPAPAAPQPGADAAP